MDRQKIESHVMSVKAAAFDQITELNQQNKSAQQQTEVVMGALEKMANIMNVEKGTSVEALPGLLTELLNKNPEETVTES